MSLLGSIIAVAGVAAVNLDSLRRGPFLFFDLFAGDHGGHGGPTWDENRPPFETVVAAGRPWVGGILKASQGTSKSSWFRAQFPRLRAVGGARYGNDWFRGAYMFLDFDKDGAAQADAYCDNIEAAGGWGPGDIIPIVDIESESAVDCSRVYAVGRACVARIKARTGQRVMLYHRGMARDCRWQDKLGADLAWTAAWMATMVTNGLTVVDGKPGPWALDDIALWQYVGDGRTSNTKFPREVPGLGLEDISVFVDGNRPSTLGALRDKLLRRGVVP